MKIKQKRVCLIGVSLILGILGWFFPKYARELNTLNDRLNDVQTQETILNANW